MPAIARAIDSGNEPLYYSVQLETYSTTDLAKARYHYFIKKFPALTDNLRVEKISGRYPLRLGAFNKKAQAAEVAAKARLIHKGAYVLHTTIPKGRIIYPLESLDNSINAVNAKNGPADKTPSAASKQLTNNMNSEKKTTEQVSSNTQVPSPAEISVNSDSSIENKAPIHADSSIAEPKGITAELSKSEQNAPVKVQGEDKLSITAQPESIAPVATPAKQSVAVSGKQSHDTFYKLASNLIGSAETGVAYAAAPAENAKTNSSQARVTPRKEPKSEHSAVRNTATTEEPKDKVAPSHMNSTASIGNGVGISTIIKKILLSLIAAGCLAILLYKQFFRKNTRTQTNINDFKHDTVLDKPRLMPRLEQLLHQNMNQAILAEESFIAADNKINSIYITSAAQKEGKTIAALNLAYALSRGSCNSVLLIDGCVEKPELHELLGTGKMPGLIDVLEGTGKLKESITKTSYQNLDFMPFGGLEDGIVKMNNLERLEQLLAALKKYYKYVIIDGASMLGTTRTAIIVSCFDGVLLSVEAERTRWEIIQLCREKIQRTNGNILGVVLTKRNFYIPRFLYGKL
jgi:capsular exopolysaccharide synthesis family protein